MRRLLLLCSLVVALSAPAASAATATPRTGPVLSVFADSVLNEDGDGVWDDALVRVSGTFSSARWTLAESSGETLAQGALSPEQVKAANTLSSRGAILVVSQASLGVALPEGEVTISVEAHSTEGTTTRFRTIWVGHGPALPPMTPQSPVFYAYDSYPGVPHAAVLPVLIPREFRARTSAEWQVVDARGAVVAGPYGLAADAATVSWTGDAHTTAAPPGVYRIQLIVSSSLDRHELGPLSAPVRLSHDVREIRDVTTFQRAATTKVRTVTRKRAGLRNDRGTLRYRSAGVGQRRALVRTEHVVRFPRTQVVAPSTIIKIEGTNAHPFGFDLELRGRDGRWHDVSVFALLDRRRVWGFVPARLIGADGRFRFRVVWRGPYRGATASMVRVGVQTSQYVWRRG